MAATFAQQPPGGSFGGCFAGELFGRGAAAAAPEDIPVEASGGFAAAGPSTSGPVFVFGQALSEEAGLGVGPSVSRPPAKKERAPIGGKLRKAPAASGPAFKAADAAAAPAAWQQQPPVTAGCSRPEHHQQQQQESHEQELQQQPTAEEPKAPAAAVFQFGGSSASSSPPPQETASNPFSDASSYCSASASSASSPFVFGLSFPSAAPAAAGAAEACTLFGGGVSAKVPGAPAPRSSSSSWAAGSNSVGGETASWTGMRSKLAEAAMQQASGHVAENRYGDAMQALLPALDGDDAALELSRQCVASWLRSERQLVVDHDGEQARLQVQLNAARDRLDALKLKKDQELAQERRLRAEAQQKVAALQHRIHAHHEVLQENCRLRQQLQRAEAKGRGPPGREDVVRELAKLECRPLKDCRAESERAALKKKLLLKWHPDKQPSAQSAVLATQVMQELQNQSEWSL